MQTVEVKRDCLADLSLHVWDRSARGNTAREVRDIGRIVRPGVFNDDRVLMSHREPFISDVHSSSISNEYVSITGFASKREHIWSTCVRASFLFAGPASVTWK